ncbi:MAG: Fur family transcriptional regulator [Eubacteriaceae bacterium]
MKPSYTRIKIYDYLIKTDAHPTVDMIFIGLIKEIPTLSKTTVYNTLKLLIKNNLVRLVSIEDNETRYDANVADHGHFKCLNCGNVFDFDIKISDNTFDDLKDFRIDEMNVYFKGICNKCKNIL